MRGAHLVVFWSLVGSWKICLFVLCKGKDSEDQRYGWDSRPIWFMITGLIFQTMSSELWELTHGSKICQWSQFWRHSFKEKMRSVIVNHIGWLSQPNLKSPSPLESSPQTCINSRHVQLSLQTIMLVTGPSASLTAVTKFSSEAFIVQTSVRIILKISDLSFIHRRVCPSVPLLINSCSLRRVRPGPAAASRSR